ncbi:MAG: hypothetical protein EOO41_04315, partial [Methanobacteriota archaeon]
MSVYEAAGGGAVSAMDTAVSALRREREALSQRLTEAAQAASDLSFLNRSLQAAHAAAQAEKTEAARRAEEAEQQLAHERAASFLRQRAALHASAPAATTTAATAPLSYAAQPRGVHGEPSAAAADSTLRSAALFRHAADASAAAPPQLLRAVPPSNLPPSHMVQPLLPVDEISATPMYQLPPLDTWAGAAPFPRAPAGINVLPPTQPLTSHLSVPRSMFEPNTPANVSMPATTALPPTAFSLAASSIRAMQETQTVSARAMLDSHVEMSGHMWEAVRTAREKEEQLRRLCLCHLASIIFSTARALQRRRAASAWSRWRQRTAASHHATDRSRLRRVQACAVTAVACHRARHTAREVLIAWRGRMQTAKREQRLVYQLRRTRAQCCRRQTLRAWFALVQRAHTQRRACASLARVLLTVLK